ncbi:hypothetical protein GGI25_000337 [Coemansia spiralis]|uniref:DOD-type homing endonuclease domain-containing protein n=2 Tax=Coemansia TaxID=4863 RepID=A0A9W8GCN2_9FUNG|nr:peptidase family M41-domain-containing protein [Coemansia spiralis]KAJ1996274.1 hypothetical protein EDC05_000164 [Coemansia umbellata]KAJ2625968.1 hypothetical protein GGI26_000052 [Coemansia sp. RSA 1358]KAJ2680702.1 hypothetical protein GGI25_000337 [Coemansia spiralis]
MQAYSPGIVGAPIARSVQGVLGTLRQKGAAVFAIKSAWTLDGLANADLQQKELPLATTTKGDFAALKAIATSESAPKTTTTIAPSDTSQSNNQKAKYSIVRSQVALLAGRGLNLLGLGARTSKQVASRNYGLLTHKIRQFSTQSQASGWGSYSSVSSRSSTTSEASSANASFDFAAQRRLTLLKGEADSKSDNANAQNTYYRELLKPNMRGIKSPLVITRIEQGEFAADIATLQLYLLALMQSKATPERAALRLVDMLKNKPQLVKQIVGTNGTAGVEKLVQTLADQSGVSSFVNGDNADLGQQKKDRDTEELLKLLKEKKRTWKDVFFDDDLYDTKDKPMDSKDNGNSGTSERPVHVIVQEKNTSTVWAGMKWLISTFIYAFCILTVVSLVFESSGLMKAATKATDFTPTAATTNVKFSDVQGCEEAKEELKELVEFLRNPHDFTEIGGRLPKGVLLTGPPGTGKTLLARAVAGEAGVPFFFMSGSEFDEVYVGVGASVTGDTMVLVKDSQGTRLMPIGEYIDTYYPGSHEGYVIPVDGVQTLGYNGRDKLEGCDWKQVRQVYRHKIDEIYEIKFMGDMIRTTGDHSVFIRTASGVKAIQARDLRVGDSLVDLPYSAHPGSKRRTSLRVSPGQYTAKHGDVPAPLMLCDSSVNDLQRQSIRTACLNQGIPEEIHIVPQLLWLLGIYAARGQVAGSTMCVNFDNSEHDLIQEFSIAMQETFGVSAPAQSAATATAAENDNRAISLTYSMPISVFFERQCGGEYNKKNLPELLWDTSSELFQAFIDGYLAANSIEWPGSSAAVVRSVDHSLLREIAWLASIHRIKATLTSESKAVEESDISQTLWKLEVGSALQSHVHSGDDYETGENTLKHKKAVIESIERVPFSGYVYDFCGCENEAFFGGNNPVLLHNSKVRSLFSAARGKAPSIVFIDEIDTIGSKRNPRDQSYMKQTLNQLLVDLDGFAQTEGVIFMAATNFPEVLDPALTRPGRFDRIIQVPLPDVRGRAAILKTHAEKIQLADDVNLNVVARGTPGFSGADLQNLLNIAAIEATKQRSKKVNNRHLDFAKDRIIMGSERKSAVVTPEAKLATAYHEGGHTLAAMYTPGAMPLHKVTVMPRGHALGVTVQLPENDRESINKSEYLAEIDVCMGGRAAEELIFGPEKVTSGCSSDLRRATKVATAMVTKFGMNERVGMVSYDDEDREKLSTEGKSAIEAEVRSLNEASNERVMKLLSDHREELDRLAKALVEYETLDKNEIERAIKGLPIERSDV